MLIKEFPLSFFVRWSPTRDLGAVLVSWILVVSSIYIATVVVGSEAWGGMAYFLLYAVLAAGIFGVGFPIYWMVCVNKRPISDLGLTKRWLAISLGLQGIFAAVQYQGTLGQSSLPPFERFIPLLTLSVAIGFFEALFWRGWVLLRLEEAFGVIPAIFFGSLLYAFYHIGYAMPVDEMLFLFFIGVMYAIAFRLTKNIFILWPLFQPMGQLFTLINDGLELPMISSLGFLEVLIAMLVMVWLAMRYARKFGIVSTPKKGELIRVETF
jgi:uncharacterized protein